jgi:hypothetical protein
MPFLDLSNCQLAPLENESPSADFIGYDLHPSLHANFNSSVYYEPSPLESGDIRESKIAKLKQYIASLGEEMHGPWLVYEGTVGRVSERRRALIVYALYPKDVERLASGLEYGPDASRNFWQHIRGGVNDDNIRVLIKRAVSGFVYKDPRLETLSRRIQVADAQKGGLHKKANDAQTAYYAQSAQPNADKSETEQRRAAMEAAETKARTEGVNATDVYAIMDELWKDPVLGHGMPSILATAAHSIDKKDYDALAGVLTTSNQLHWDEESALRPMLIMAWHLASSEVEEHRQLAESIARNVSEKACLTSRNNNISGLIREDVPNYLEREAASVWADIIKCDTDPAAIHRKKDATAVLSPSALERTAAKAWGEDVRSRSIRPEVLFNDLISSDKPRHSTELRRQYFSLYKETAAAMEAHKAVDVTRDYVLDFRNAPSGYGETVNFMAALCAYNIQRLPENEREEELNKIATNDNIPNNNPLKVIAKASLEGHKFRISDLERLTEMDAARTWADDFRAQKHDPQEAFQKLRDMEIPPQGTERRMQYFNLIAESFYQRSPTKAVDYLRYNKLLEAPEDFRIFMSSLWLDNVRRLDSDPRHRELHIAEESDRVQSICPSVPPEMRDAAVHELKKIEGEGNPRRIDAFNAKYGAAMLRGLAS